MSQQINDTEKDTSSWYVMCHLKPQQIETMLQKDSAGLLCKQGDTPLQPYRFYVPFLYMPLLPTDDKRQSTDKHDDLQDDVNALRNDLHDFVFIQASEERIRQIVDSEWNHNARLRLYHYRDTNRQEVKISDEEVRQLMETIQKRHLHFYIDQPLADFAADDRVILQMEPWRGKRGVVKKVAIKKGQLCMTISMNILGRTKSINFTDVRVGDVIFEDAERGRILSSDPISNYEEEIIDILSHRFARYEPDDVAELDRQRLKRLLTYNHIYVDSAVEKARFAALKLICAYLLHSERKRNSYQQEVTELLNGKETAETDSDAYLMVALFITTRMAHWRNAVKDYRHTHPDSLPVLRRYHAILKNLKARRPIGKGQP